MQPFSYSDEIGFLDYFQNKILIFQLPYWQVKNKIQFRHLLYLGMYAPGPKWKYPWVPRNGWGDFGYAESESKISRGLTHRNEVF